MLKARTHTQRAGDSGWELVALWQIRGILPADKLCCPGESGRPACSDRTGRGVPGTGKGQCSTAVNWQSITGTMHFPKTLLHPYSCAMAGIQQSLHPFLESVFAWHTWSLAALRRQQGFSPAKNCSPVGKQPGHAHSFFPFISCFPYHLRQSCLPTDSFSLSTSGDAAKSLWPLGALLLHMQCLLAPVGTEKDQHSFAQPISTLLPATPLHSLEFIQQW